GAGHRERPRVERDGALGSVEEEALSRRRAQLGGVLGEAQRIIEDPKDGEEEPGGPDDVLAVVPDDGGQCRGIAAAEKLGVRRGREESGRVLGAPAAKDFLLERDQPTVARPRAPHATRERKEIDV